MSYGIQYRSQFNNDLNQEFLILLAQKDVPEATTISNFESVELELNDSSEENDDDAGQAAIIIAREAVLTINADENTPITWETFLAGAYDEWWMIIFCEGHAVFEGFLTPEEGASPFLDKPYDVTVRATNGLKLLKDVPLVKPDGSKFKGKFKLIEYIAAALHQTLLNNISSGNGIPLRIYSNIYEPSMAYRGEDITSDFYQHIKLDHRTFMTDATSFVSCYEALTIILKRHSRLFYWNGRWVIKLLAEHQWAPAGVYYTEYNADGSVISGQEDLEQYATVGKAELIYPVDEAVQLSAEFAIKEAKTTFNYDIIKEIPLNNRFDRGTHIDQGVAIDETDLDGDGNTTESIGTYHEYTIDDWYNGLNRGGSDNNAFPALLPSPELATFRKIYSVYNIELQRIVLLPRLNNTAGERWLISSPLPVRADDKFNLSFDFRLSKDLGQFSARVAYIIVKGTGTTRWSLLWSESEGKKWFNTSGGNANRGVVHNWQAADDARKWVSFNIEAPPIPITGTMYIVLADNIPDNNHISYFTGFNFEYIPYVAGGYVPVKGEYVAHRQSANMIDVNAEEIYMADSPIQLARGAMYHEDETPTTPTWFRHGVIESKKFIELANLRVYNFGYRRFYKLLGPFTSNEYEPFNDQLNKQPIGYHKNYRFVDFPEQREFILNVPLRMNMMTGDIDAEFQEVIKVENVNQDPDTMEDVLTKIVGAINNTTASEWDSNGTAPSAGTPYFPPQAGMSVDGPIPRSIGVTYPAGHPITFTADDGGAGNSPSVAVYFDVTAGGKRDTIFQLGADIAPGNKFTFSLFGHTIEVEVVNNSKPYDGTQAPTPEFNFIFG